jgi:hypothetical protein
MMVAAHEVYGMIRKAALPLSVLAQEANSPARRVADEVEYRAHLLDAIAEAATGAYNGIADWDCMGDGGLKFEAEALLRAIAVVAATGARAITGSGGNSIPALDGDHLVWAAEVHILSDILWERFKPTAPYGEWAWADHQPQTTPAE